MSSAQLGKPDPRVPRSHTDENSEERVLKMKLFLEPHQDFVGLRPRPRRSGPEEVERIARTLRPELAEGILSNG